MWSKYATVFPFCPRISDRLLSLYGKAILWPCFQLSKSIFIVLGRIRDCTSTEGFYLVSSGERLKAAVTLRRLAGVHYKRARTRQVVDIFSRLRFTRYRCTSDPLFFVRLPLVELAESKTDGGTIR